MKAPRSLCAVPLLVFPSLLGAQTLSETVQAELDALVERTTMPGASLAILLPGGECIEVASGFADVEKEEPMKPGARILAGSTGKTFFAALALSLSLEERIDLDQEVAEVLGENDWFQRLPNADAGFTLRQLLDHSSGIPEYYLQPAFRPELAKDPTRRWKTPDLLAFVFDLEPAFAPGEGFQYSDSNYLVAGLALEALTGEKVYDLVEARFLDPLGLKDTLPSTQSELPGLTPGYTTEPNYFGLPRKLAEDGRHYLDPSFEWCGGGYVSNARDLARWAKALYSGAAIDGDDLPQLLAGRPARIGTEHVYGLGTMILETDLGELRAHTGFFPGYLTAMGYFPDHDLAVAVQFNSDDTRLLEGYITRYLVSFAESVLGR